MRPWILGVALAFFIGGLVLSIGRQHKACEAKGGKLVQGIPGYICVKAEVLK